MAVWPAAVIGSLPVVLHAQSGVTAGTFTVERQALVSLGFEWRIAGDENRDAAVEVAYREQGEVDWHPALPLFRLQNEPVTGTYYRYIAANMFAGLRENAPADHDVQ